MTAGWSPDRRREVLLGLGASPSEADEVLTRSRGDGWWPAGAVALGTLPVPDEPMIEAWSDYAARAEAEGAWAVLRGVLVQLRFPIRDGISSEPGYRATTLRGEPPPAGGGLELVDPDGLSLRLHPSLAGTIPVLAVTQRADFEALVRALTARNEPVPVPPAMGACLVNALNNWDRIRRHRERWQAAPPETRTTSTWPEELRRIVPQPALYKDRLIVLSREPYSGVAAADAGFPEGAWNELSFAIRLEHECVHALTLRIFGALRHDLLEELVADWVGLRLASGAYRLDLARLFLGLERFPAYRSGGRLEVYRGSPPLSDGAFRVVQRLAFEATATLAELPAALPGELDDARVLARLTVALLTLPVEALVEPAAARHVTDRLDGLETVLAG